MFATTQQPEPDNQLPASLTGKRIALKLTGGVGDVIIALGGGAAALCRAGATVTVGARDFQLPMLRAIDGVSDAAPVTRFNDPIYRRNFDAVIDLGGVFASQRQIRDAEYYGLVSARLGMEVHPPRFKLPTYEPYRHTVYMHASASNPNRCWPSGRWIDLAYEFGARGFNVIFLGVRSDFGFTDHQVGFRVSALSETDECLLWQISELSRGDLFIGNDSGFAHVAGCLGVPGVVLFGNTHPRNVIAQYPKLMGLHVYDLLGVTPSRSLRADDAISLQCMQALSVASVVKAVEHACPEFANAIECTITRNPGKPVKARVKVIGADPVTRSELLAWFDLECVEHSEEPVVRFDGHIRPGDLLIDARLVAHDKRNLIQSWLNRGSNLSCQPKRGLG